MEDEAFEPEERQDNGDSDILQDASDNDGTEAHDTTDSESEYNEAALDDGQEPEDEPIIISVEGNSREQIFSAKVDAMLRKEAALRDFISENQPDDETRNRLALLQMPVSKIYAEEDLSDEITMKVGLHLLYNKIQGKKELHLGKSIHIKYWTFPSDVTVSMERI